MITSQPASARYCTRSIRTLSATCPFLSGGREITIWKGPMNWKINDGGKERASPVQNTDQVERKLYGGNGPCSIISSSCSKLASPSLRRSTGHPLPPPASASPLLLLATPPSFLLPFTRSDPHASFSSSTLITMVVNYHSISFLMSYLPCYCQEHCFSKSVVSAC